MTDPDVVLQTMRDSRRLLTCRRSLGAVWRTVWMEGARRPEASNAVQPLRRLVDRKRVNLAKLYEDNSEEQMHALLSWASLAWLLEQIEAAEAKEV